MKGLQTLDSAPKTDEGKLKFGSHLKAFIESLEEDPEKQKEILSIAVQNFAPFDVTGLEKANCKKCYGRGFTAYNRTYNHFTICKCLLKQLPAQAVTDHHH